MDTVKIPGPDHPITVAGHPRRMQARYKGHVIADSGDVLMLHEASYKPVAYFPRADVDMAWLTRTDRDTYCPYKGHANYFTLMMDGAIAENAAWTYEHPYPAMDIIRDRLAFFPHPVEVYEVKDDPARPSPGEVILHTDEGDGATQRDHWAATARDPTPPE